jgi:NADH:ubiquinone reductase (non-electrogenic)
MVTQEQGFTRRLLLLGTGFGAFNLLRNLPTDFDITVVSPRNHFLFTPLLPSTTVGTIEFRSIIEPIRHARQNLRFYHATAENLDLDQSVVACRGLDRSDIFDVPYDMLVVAVGAVSNTFGVPGVGEHALFLRELQDAQELRGRIIACFERANLPGLPAPERTRQLHFVICGGGATGVEFAAELHDFLSEDLIRAYPHLVPETQITIVEGGKEILSTFDEHLRHYALDLFTRQRIQVVTNSPVVKVDAQSVSLADGSLISYGLLLWSTGNGPTTFVHNAPLPKDSRSRILVDSNFRVKGFQNIFAIGDCCSMEDTPLPATAQVAQQEGKYLARAIPRLAQNQPVAPFHYRNLGMLAYIGGDQALADTEAFKASGRTTWLFWRSAYLSRIVSLKNKVLVLFDWFKALIFGRDISQF